MAALPYSLSSSSLSCRACLDKKEEYPCQITRQENEFLDETDHPCRECRHPRRSHVSASVPVPTAPVSAAVPSLPPSFPDLVASELANSASVRLASIDRTVYQAFYDHVEANGPMSAFSLPHAVPYELLRKKRFVKDKFTFIYRPDIFRPILSNAIAKCDSLQVEGTHGSGKSHSLYQLYIYLLCKPQDYIVTFIPDASQWIETPQLFFFRVAESFGINPALLPQVNEELWNAWFIRFLLPYLKSNQLKWVLIFDQINAVFSHFNRKEQPMNYVYKIQDLPFPFKLMMNQVADRIIPIISASANNEPFYNTENEHFTSFHHPVRFNSQELDEFKRIEKPLVLHWDAAVRATGGIPLELSILRDEFQWDYEKYYRNRSRQYFRLHEKLLRKEDEKEVEKHQMAVYQAIQAINQDMSDITFYDRKLIYEEKEQLLPINDAAKDALRAYHLDYLLDRTHIERQLYIQCLGDANFASSPAAGHIFESVVIASLSRSHFHFPFSSEIRLARDSMRFIVNNSSLPLSVGEQKFSIWIPKHFNYRAVDCFILGGATLIAIQITIDGNHADSCEDFKTHSFFSPLISSFLDVHFVWLSPPSLRTTLAARFGHKYQYSASASAAAVEPRRSKRQRTSLAASSAPVQAVFYQHFIATSELPCLQDIRVAVQQAAAPGAPAVVALNKKSRATSAPQ